MKKKKYSYIFENSSTNHANIHVITHYPLFLPTSSNIKFRINEVGRVLRFFELSSKGVTYYMIVSQDITKYQTVEIKIGSIKVKELTPVKSGLWDINIYTDTIITRVLIPGGYRIFQVVE